ncbi:MAG: ABC transporter substrate-binding protein, partial [Croceibacterium sp.]
LGLDLSAIAELRTMAGRVVEVRLSRPMPMLLQLLAQPELDLARGGPSGPMRMQRQGRIVLLQMKPPRERGEPEAQDWQAHVRPIRLVPATARNAITRFDEGEVDLVLGGRLGALPLADTGPLSRGTVRIDPAIGLFGLQVRLGSGFLARDENREVIALALDRQELLGLFNVGGWNATTRLVPAGLSGDPGLIEERWNDAAMDDRRAAATQRVAAWRSGNGPVRLTLAMGQGPGLDLLYRELARQYAAVGIRLDRVAESAPADLELVDQVARYASPLWFLNQFNCALRRGLCESGVDALVAEANRTADPQARAGIMARAEAQLTLSNVFIPIASPMRFSLVRGTVDGYAPNAWAWHPLQAFAVIPR